MARECHKWGGANWTKSRGANWTKSRGANWTKSRGGKLDQKQGGGQIGPGGTLPEIFLIYDILPKRLFLFLDRVEK